MSGCFKVDATEGLFDKTAVALIICPMFLFIADFGTILFCRAFVAFNLDLQF